MIEQLRGRVSAGRRAEHGVALAFPPGPEARRTRTPDVRSGRLQARTDLDGPSSCRGGGADEQSTDMTRPTPQHRLLRGVIPGARPVRATRARVCVADARAGLDARFVIPCVWSTQWQATRADLARAGPAGSHSCVQSQGLAAKIDGHGWHSLGRDPTPHCPSAACGQAVDETNTISTGQQLASSWEGRWAPVVQGPLAGGAQLRLVRPLFTWCASERMGESASPRASVPSAAPASAPPERELAALDEHREDGGRLHLADPGRPAAGGA